MEPETVQITEADLQQLANRVAESGTPGTIDSMTVWLIEIISRRVAQDGEG